MLTFSGDPRGMAFLDDSARFVGQDGVIIVSERRLSETLDALQFFFSRFDPPQIVTLRRDGNDEIPLALVPAHGLTRAFPVPYPH